MKGDYSMNDWQCRFTRLVDVLFNGWTGDEFGMVWDGYTVETWSSH